MCRGVVFLFGEYGKRFVDTGVRLSERGFAVVTLWNDSAHELLNENSPKYRLADFVEALVDRCDAILLLPCWETHRLSSAVLNCSERCERPMFESIDELEKEFSSDRCQCEECGK